MTTAEATRIGVRDARAGFPALVDEAAEGHRFVVTLYGRDRAAIVSMADLRRLEELDSEAKPAKRR